MTRQIKIMGTAFIGMGVLHFAKPGPFENIVPKALPRKKELVYASGVVEVATGAMMLHPRTRRLGGLGAVGLPSSGRWPGTRPAARERLPGTSSAPSRGCPCRPR
jgi:hypothetical protein